jgi:hypothetical protein
MLGGVIGATVLALCPRGRAEPPASPALSRLLDAMAPGSDELPGARATDATPVLARRIESTPASLHTALDALVTASAQATPLDAHALEAIQRAHPEAMAWLTQALFEHLYGSARHGGAGERRAFRTLQYP